MAESKESFEEFMKRMREQDPIYELEIWTDTQCIARLNKLAGQIHKATAALGRNPENKQLRHQLTLYFKFCDADNRCIPNPDDCTAKDYGIFVPDNEDNQIMRDKWEAKKNGQ